MAGVKLGTLGSAAGVIAGFQVGAFTWRITREVNMSDTGEAVWLPVADLPNLASLAVTLLGVFVTAALDLVGPDGATLAFAWAVLYSPRGRSQ
jgi:hypothetical protein